LVQCKKEKTGPQAGFFFLAVGSRAYWLAPDAGAAAEAPMSEAAAGAEAAAPVSEAGAEGAAAGAEAAGASLAGAAALWSLLLLHAARATAANRDATRRDFFMITSFYG
jgi:hypothetical protein